MKTTIKKILKSEFKNWEAVEFRTNSNKPRLCDQGEWSGEYSSLNDLNLDGFKGTGTLVCFGETKDESYFLDINFVDGKITSFESEVNDN